ncbi:MAG: hypothetical protein R3B89_16450 [Polyangiaceae bacterium]
MRKGLTATSLLLVFASAFSCSREESEPTTTFYDRNIAPTLIQSCVTSPSGSQCHVTADDRGNALGNLSLESYEDLQLRRDLFINYGPYGLPNLLLKTVPPFQMRLTSWDNQVEIITTDIPHAGGSIFDRSSSSLLALLRWIERGATENNGVRQEDKVPQLPCSNVLGSDPDFDPTTDPPDADFASFRDNVNGVLADSCAAGNCHGSPPNSLYLTCGASPEEIRWNYFAASGYVSSDPPASEVLRRTLAPGQGGTYHEGGTIFESTDAQGYRDILGWATEKGGPSGVPTNAGFQFFASRVQPMLAKKGCMIIGCHSPAMFHDYRLRGGSGGHFGLPATRRNYGLTLEQVALESTTPNASRLVRKNLDPNTQDGILHRGGALLASQGADPATCDLDAAANGPLDDQPPYCVIAAWIALEKQERLSGALPLSGFVYVKRPPRSGRDAPQDWDDYQPGADLMRRGASVAADGVISVDGSEESLLAGCGLSVASADVRRPQVSWDGQRIAFSARSGADQAFKVYVIDGTSCAVEPTIDAAPVDDAGNPITTNGELVHNFDPTFAPDGRIVFASTRGNTKNTKVFSYQGPQRTPADPSKLNVNLYVAEDGKVRQLTFLLNQELLPSFMSDGRLIFTTEKRTPGFYQLAGRRQNLDGGDYHPLFAQRATVGFDQFTEIVELSDKNLAAIFSEKGAAHGAGTLGVVNRSIGIDQRSQDEADYTRDPSAIGYPAPAFYQHSIRIPDGRATGHLDQTDGAYRSPSPLPNGRVVISYASGVSDLGNFSGNFDIYEINPSTGGRTALIQDAQDLLWPVAIYARQNREVFKSRADEANGSTRVFTDPERSDRSDITVLDFPVLSSLLFQNTRSGRDLPPNGPISIYESLPPEPGVTSFDQGGKFVTSDDFGQVYARRRLVGVVQPLQDGSARVQIPGGVPIVLAPQIALAGDSEPRMHFQREEMQFYPGEWVKQSFQRQFFNGLCGGCHGSVSGLEKQVALNPDILTSASAVSARDHEPSKGLQPGGDFIGPPFD